MAQERRAGGRGTSGGGERAEHILYPRCAGHRARLSESILLGGTSLEWLLELERRWMGKDGVR